MTNSIRIISVKFQVLKNNFLGIFCAPLLLLFFISHSSTAGEPGNWTIFVNQTRLHKNWSLHNELQYRSFDLLPNTEQSLFRVGLNYHFDANLIFTAGLAHIGTFKNESHFNNERILSENRSWEQITLKSNQGRLLFEHRYRVEQRWIKANEEVSYKNRIRYLFRTTIPLTNKVIARNVFFLSFYDEVFLNLNSSPFDRNRLFASAGYQFNKNANVQCGYLMQTVGSISKNYLQLVLNYNLDFRKSD